MICETIYFVAFIGLGFFLEYILFALLSCLERRGILHSSFDKDGQSTFDIGSYVIFVFVSFFFLLYYVDFCLLKYDGIVYALLLGCTGLFIRIICDLAERLITAFSKIIIILMSHDFEKISRCWKKLLENGHYCRTILKWTDWDDGITVKERNFTWLILSVSLSLYFLFYKSVYAGNTQLVESIEKAFESLILIIIGYFIWIDIDPRRIFKELSEDLKNIKGHTLFVLLTIVAMFLLGICTGDLSGKFSLALLIGIIIGVMKDRYEKNKLLSENALMTNNKEDESHNPDDAG